MDDFRDSAMRMMDEDSSAAPAQPQDTSPRMTKGDILTAAEAKQQEMEREMLPPEKADEVAPGTIVVLPDGTKLVRQKEGVVKWGIVGAEKNSIALADSAAEKLLENGFRIFSKDKKGKQNETRANEAQPQSEQTQSVVPPAGETARPVEAGEATPEVGAKVVSNTFRGLEVPNSATDAQKHTLEAVFDDGKIVNISVDDKGQMRVKTALTINGREFYYDDIVGKDGNIIDDTQSTDETASNGKGGGEVAPVSVDNLPSNLKILSAELAGKSGDPTNLGRRIKSATKEEILAAQQEIVDALNDPNPQNFERFFDRLNSYRVGVEEMLKFRNEWERLHPDTKIKYGKVNIERYITIEEAVEAGKAQGYDVSKNPAFNVNRKGWRLPNGTVVIVHNNIPSPWAENKLIRREIVRHNEKLNDVVFFDSTTREAQTKVGREATAPKTAAKTPTSASTETEVNTPPTTTESIEGGSGADESEEDGEDSVDIDYDPDLPPDSLEDESESSASVKDEILPLVDLEEPLADEEEEVLSSEDLEKPTRETKVPKLLTLPDTQEKFDELTRRLHTPIAQGGVSEKSQKGKAVQAEIERMKKAGWKPSEAQPLPPTNRLRRADGTDPLVDKTQTTTYTTAAEPIDNETATTYNTEIKTPPTSNNKGETTNEEPERTQEGSKDESTVQVTESGDDFSRLQEASQAMPDSERALYRTGRKSLDEDDLGRAFSKWSKRRRGRIVDVLRKRVNASNGGSNLSGVKTLSTRKEGKVLEYFDFGRTDGQTFRDVFEVVRNYLPNGELADLHDNYGDDVKCYLSEDGLCGFAVEADGNLVSVFSLRPGSLKAMKNSILAAGATHLDAYASKNQDLADIFSDVLGFKVASRMDYNMDYDHDNIAANHGNPDVVFMVKPEKNQVIEEKHYGKDDYEVAQYNQKYQAKRRSHEDKLRHNRIKGGLDALKDNSIANKDSVALKQILADIDYMRKGDDAKWFMAFGLKDDSDILSLENAIQGRLNGNDIYALSQTAENDWRKVNFERLESENANERDAAFRALAKAYISNLNAYNKAQASQEIDDGVKTELENRVKFLTSAISNMSESDRQKFNKLVDDAESDLANKGTAEYQEAIGDRDELVTSEGERSDEENDLGAGGSGVTVNKQFEETESATQSRSGNRDNGYISLEDGNVVWHNALGDVVKKVPANVLDVVGKNNAEVKSLVDNLRKGQTVYMSVKDVESSIERDRRFTEDKDYQIGRASCRERV